MKTPTTITIHVPEGTPLPPFPTPKFGALLVRGRRHGRLLGWELVGFYPLKHDAHRFAETLPKCDGVAVIPVKNAKAIRLLGPGGEEIRKISVTDPRLLSP